MIVFAPRLTPGTLTAPRIARGVVSPLAASMSKARERWFGELVDPRDIASDFGPGGTDPNDRPPSPE